MIRVHEDGTGVTLHIAAAEIGQGSDTVLVQMAAEELGVPYEWVWMADCDTTVSPLDLGSYSSRVTLMGGQRREDGGATSRRSCARWRRASSAATAAAPRGARWAHLRPRASVGGDGLGRPRRGSRSRKAARWSARGRTRRRKHLGGEFKGGTVGTSPAYSFSTAIAEVTVDLETGYVTVDRFTDYSDAGTVINPVTLPRPGGGRDHHGTGRNAARGHDRRRRRTALESRTCTTTSFRRSATSPEIHTAAVESFEPRGPFGAKEIGEGSLLPVLGAIANAIYDACGVRVTELPITPEKILRGLASRRGTVPSLSGPLPHEFPAVPRATAE